MSVFVTVGTTKFEKLIHAVDSSIVQDALRKKGFSRLVIQIGNGQYEPLRSSGKGLDIEFYRFKPSLEEDFKNADLVISHGGYGCLIESLTLRKPVIAVINDTLMDNHQVEIAQELERRNLLVKCKPETLAITIEETDLTKFDELEKAKPENYVKLLDNMFGF